jgi:hypothetical protein
VQHGEPSAFRLRAGVGRRRCQSAATAAATKTFKLQEVGLVAQKGGVVTGALRSSEEGLSPAAAGLQVAELGLVCMWRHRGSVILVCWYAVVGARGGDFNQRWVISNSRCKSMRRSNTQRGLSSTWGVLQLLIAATFAPRLSLRTGRRSLWCRGRSWAG